MCQLLDLNTTAKKREMCHKWIPKSVISKHFWNWSMKRIWKNIFIVVLFNPPHCQGTQKIPKGNKASAASPQSNPPRIDLQTKIPRWRREVSTSWKSVSRFPSSHEVTCYQTIKKHIYTWKSWILRSPSIFSSANSVLKSLFWTIFVKKPGNGEKFWKRETNLPSLKLT